MRMSITQLYFLIRQAGLRLVAVSQAPGDLASAALSQSGLVIQVGGVAFGNDVRAIAAALGLTHDQAACLPHLKKGEFIARENMGRYTKPFRGMFHLFPAPTIPFSKADRVALMRPLLDSMPTIPAVPVDVVEKALHPTASSASPARVPAGISNTACNLGSDVLTHPWDCLNVRYGRLNLSARVAQKAKEELVDHGLVREHPIAKQGMSPILLEPLAPLAAALGRTLPSWGKGGYLHAFIQHCAARWFKTLKYTNIRQEAFYGSKAVDVVAITPTGEIVGVEATVSLANLADNLEKDFLVCPRFSLITVICMSASDVRQAKRVIAAAPGLAAFTNRIEVDPLSHWL